MSKSPETASSGEHAFDLPPSGSIDRPTPIPNRRAETVEARALRIAIDLRKSHSDLRIDVDKIVEAMGKPPNPVDGFAGSGLHKPLYEVLLLTRSISNQRAAEAAAKAARNVWTTWAARVVIGALLLTLTSGSLLWLTSLHH